MKNLLEEKNLLDFPRIGEVIKSRLIGIGRSAVFFDLGSFGTGIIYGREYYNAKDMLKDLKTGDEIMAKIVDIDNEEGYVELSIRQAGQEMKWKKLKEEKEKEKTLTVKILGANKGGLLSEISGIPAFLPVSQLSLKHYPRIQQADKTKIFRELQKFIGEEFTVKIFDVDPGNKKLILSEKLKEAEKTKKALNRYKVGDIVEGEITGVADFGAFIKFSGLDGKTSSDKKDKKDKKENKKQDKTELEGLIHISELDWQLINDPSEVVKIGQKVKAKIIEISQDRISLSLKALKKDPWQGIEKKYKKGDAVKGKITKFNPFGAFVKISPKIQGLVHISEFSSKEKMEKELELGKEYNFEILFIDPKAHKMTLKLLGRKK